MGQHALKQKNVKTAIVSILLGIFAITAGFSSEAIVMGFKGSANIRKSPQSNSALIAEVKDGTRLVVLEKKGNTTKVKTAKGQEGYMLSKFLLIQPDIIDAAVPTKVATAVEPAVETKPVTGKEAPIIQMADLENSLEENNDGSINIQLISPNALVALNVVYGGYLGDKMVDTIDGPMLQGLKVFGVADENPHNNIHQINIKGNGWDMSLDGPTVQRFNNINPQGISAFTSDYSNTILLVITGGKGKTKYEVPIIIQKNGKVVPFPYCGN